MSGSSYIIQASLDQRFQEYIMLMGLFIPSARAPFYWGGGIENWARCWLTVLVRVSMSC